MKKILFVLLILMMLSLTLFVLASCSCEPAATTQESTTTVVLTTAAPEITAKPLEEFVNGLPVYVDGNLFIIEDGKTNYTPNGMGKHRVLYLKEDDAQPRDQTVRQMADYIDRCAMWVYRK